MFIYSSIYVHEVIVSLNVQFNFVFKRCIWTRILSQIIVADAFERFVMHRALAIQEQHGCGDLFS